MNVTFSDRSSHERSISIKLRKKKDSNGKKILMLEDSRPEELSEINTTITVKESKTTIDVGLDFVHSSTINLNYYFRFLTLYNAMHDAALWGSHDPTKEITESVSALRNTINYLKEKYGKIDIFNNTNVLCLCVADGMRPQTGTLFAIKTKWQVYSIDPLMNSEYKHDYANLHCVSSLVEDCHFDFEKYELVVVIGVHSHANLDDLWIKIGENKKFLLSIPCCGGIVHTVEGVEPVFDLFDGGIYSPKKRVIAYMN